MLKKIIFICLVSLFVVAYTGQITSLVNRLGVSKLDIHRHLGIKEELFRKNIKDILQ